MEIHPHTGACRGVQLGWQAYQQRLQQIGYPLDFVYLTTTCSPVMWDNAPPNPFLPDLIQRFTSLGIDKIGGTPEQFGQAIRADLPRFAKVVKETGAKVD